MMRFGMRPIRASGTAAPTIAMPNSLRRLKSFSRREAGTMPAASPTNIAAKTRPQPALPPCSV